MIDKIRQASPKVAGEHEAYKRALEEEVEARGRVLAGVRDLVKDALPALCSQVLVGGRIARQEQTREVAPWRGLKIGGTGLLPRLVPGQRGNFRGHDLYLSEEGVFTELRYSGHWSGITPLVSEWGSTAQELSGTDVAREHDTDVIIARVIRAITEQLGGEKPEKTRGLRAMAARLDAVAAMLKAPL